MGCFDLQWFEQVLVWLVIIGAIVALVKLLLPLVLTNLGVAGGTIMAAINIIMWAVITIFIIYFIFDLIACLGGGLRLPHRP